MYTSFHHFIFCIYCKGAVMWLGLCTPGWQRKYYLAGSPKLQSGEYRVAHVSVYHILELLHTGP